jgi:peptidoglycan/xylan/chitin deacetylase (PgdA/CDA1 family)
MTEYTPPRARIATPPVRDRPFLRLPGDDPGMVLTFDDGPDPRYTPDILRTLRRHDVRAMFFVVGEMVYDNRDLLRRIADDGHVIGNHTWTHPLLPKLSAAGIRDEIGRTGELIDRVLGEPPRWFRAPYGAWNGHTFRIGAELGMEPMAWSLDTLDWENGAETGRIARAVVAGAGPGVVVLSHDAGGDRRPSMAALRSYLPELLDAGYTITVPPRPRPEFPDAAD